MDHYPRYPGDYIRDTLTLTMAEDGAYSRLMDLYYATEKPIKKGPDLYPALRCRTRQERDAVDTILRCFFQYKNGYYYHLRIEEEIKKFQNIRERNKKNGKSGGRPPGKKAAK